MRTTQSAISDLENGSTDPRLSTLQRYARAVGCQLEIRVKDYPKALRPEYAHEELEIKPVRVIRGDADAHWTIRPVGRTDIRIAVIPHVGIAPVARKDSVAR
jgi:transcriptional regulator with XRE-family HTH domain